MKDKDHQIGRIDEHPPWSTLVAKNLAPALIILTLGFGEPAWASAAGAKPEFSQEQLHVIERNQSLKAILRREPWLVYRVLKELEQGDSARHARSVQPGIEGRPRKERFDKRRDPDLSGMERVSPEAAYDLFLLLKKVRKDQKPTTQR